MANGVVDINDSVFEEEVTKHEGAVLVDFWAPWCAPCKMVAPAVEKIAEEMGSKLKVCKMNIDENPQTPSQLGIMSIPTLMIFKNGKEEDRMVGALSAQELSRRISEKIG